MYKAIRNGVWFTRAVRACTAACTLSPLALSSGCYPGDCGTKLVLQGQLVGQDTGLPLSGAVVGLTAFRDGAEIDFISPVIFDGTSQFPPTEDDGRVAIEFNHFLFPCNVPAPAPALPSPDQVDVIVIHDGCERTVSLDINADTVVDLTFPDMVLELIDPILVPPCGG